MTFEKQIKTLSALGEYLNYFSENELDGIHDRIVAENPWFTIDMVKKSLTGIAYQLQEKKLREWLQGYEPNNNVQPKTIGLVLAGNIPLVGFHDVMCCYITGCKTLIKSSHQDKLLLQVLINKWRELDEDLNFHFVDRLKDMDAVIATGSDNAARYFDQYFGKYPNLIRKNRTSVAILDGNESKEDLISLGHDAFDYYGLGCRNISKIFIPKDFDLVKLGDAWQVFLPLVNMHKFANNYQYRRSIYLINQVEHLDYGFCLIKEDESLVSPIAVIFYQRYENDDQLKKLLSVNEEKIQCIVGNKNLEGFRSITPGEAQKPEPWDYADGEDTLKFLLGL